MIQSTVVINLYPSSVWELVWIPRTGREEVGGKVTKNTVEGLRHLSPTTSHSIFHIAKKLLAVRNLCCLVKQDLYMNNRTHRARIVPAILSIFVWLLDDVRSQVGWCLLFISKLDMKCGTSAVSGMVVPSLSFEFFTSSLYNTQPSCATPLQSL